MSLDYSKPIFLFVNNRDRTQGQDALDFDLDLSQIIADPVNQGYNIQVNSVTMENIFPTIERGVNDSLWVVYNGTPVQLILAEGVYNINDIMTSLLAFLQGLNAAFNLLYDVEQFKLSLVVPALGVNGITSFELLRTNTNPLAPLQYKLADVTDRMLELLGWTFDGMSALNIPLGTTYVPNNVVRLRNTCMLSLCCRANIHRTYSTDPNSSYKTLLRIPLTSDIPFGTVFHYQPHSPENFELGLTNGVRLEFFFVDEWGIRKTARGKNITFGCVISLIPIINQ